MRFWWRVRGGLLSPALSEAREAREEAEQRLAEARETVILPLRELRERNHVSEAITMLIQQRADRAGT
jgi:hypothetical protein